MGARRRYKRGLAKNQPRSRRQLERENSALIGLLDQQAEEMSYLASVIAAVEPEPEPEGVSKAVEAFERAIA